MLHYIKDVIANMPESWLRLTTHRLDIYSEELAKTEFTSEFEKLYKNSNASTSALSALPTAYDYIRLGHPLSCVLEWALAEMHHLEAQNIISFSSQTAPVLAVLRKNSLENRKTRILYRGELPASFDAETLRNVYQYQFELEAVDSLANLSPYEGSTILMGEENEMAKTEFMAHIDFYVNIYPQWGSVLLISTAQKNYVSDIQHVRRRETIAMTPANCLTALKSLAGEKTSEKSSNFATDKALVLETLKNITLAPTEALLASSGLSMQYAIMMGLVDYAQEVHAGKAIKFIVPPNCYGGTNDQARRVAACLDNVEVVDLPVDGDNDMVQSVDTVLSRLAQEDAVPYIIAEIPTNPRVEVPDLNKLKAALSATRKTIAGEIAIAPVFILDQTFCPNVHFLGEEDVLSSIKGISYASGSKFPSGGECTAGYCLGNEKAAVLMGKIEKHLQLCDNEATALQTQILAKQLPSMNQRIADAYVNTRNFVTFIRETLPSAKINFVSEELAQRGFTPSVFSLDLPTQGNTDAEREAHKRELNLRLINSMINEIPKESKYCVSYGQLKGLYWTIPATSTQGTTKEGDKDYIVRASLSPNLDMEKHKAVFREFVETLRTNK
jgi:cystathionine beta-lyase/cystathionine gamma-synthase